MNQIYYQLYFKSKKFKDDFWCKINASKLIFKFFEDFDDKDKTNDETDELFDKNKNFEKNKKLQNYLKKIKEQFLLINI